jgi:hypothetical protein
MSLQNGKNVRSADDWEDNIKTDATLDKCSKRDTPSQCEFDKKSSD